MKYSNANIRSQFRLNYIKLLCLKSIFILLIFSCSAAVGAKDQKVTSGKGEEMQRVRIPPATGASNMAAYLELIKDKKVGVVGNQTTLVVRL